MSVYICLVFKKEGLGSSRLGSLLCLGCKEELFRFTSTVLTANNTVVMDDEYDGGGGDGGMKVLTWLSAERRGMERVRPCPSIG